MTTESIFAAASQKSPTERPDFLDKACGNDADLRHKVERLLAAHDQSAGILDHPADDATGAYQSRAAGEFEPQRATREKPGDQIGPYTLVEILGQGGMGAVWRAEQHEPVRRQVALKVIKSGMDSDSVIARFEAERQALAMMDHPNIAKVFDGGTTSTGRPYFVMELVQGIPITRYCDQAKMTIRERFDLMIPVCQAVQHAHQKGIIHRDLKPSNILVGTIDSRPVPKVIDFGVAKATGSSLTEQTMHTAAGSIIGTLEYMAPEQAEVTNLDIDTRADIYSLGVVLYELLTGSPPFSRRKLQSAALDEMLRMIREVEPSKPSTKLSTAEELPSVAAIRGMEPRRLTNFIRGDIDWIVMKCLEKERTRRYETANGLAMDIQRYLADEPVSAGPPSASYRFKKFVRRNRGGVMAGTAVAAALLVGIVGFAWQAKIAREQRDLAIAAQQAEAEQYAEAIRQKDLANAARALADRNFQKARSAVENYLQRVADNPDLKHRGNFQELRKQLLTAALPFFEEFVQEKSDDPAVLKDQGHAYHRLALVRHEMAENAAVLRDYNSAQAIFAQLVARYPADASYKQGLAKCHNSRGVILMETGQRDAAEADFRRAVSLQDELCAADTKNMTYRQERARSWHNVGLALSLAGKNADAKLALMRAQSEQEALADQFPAVSDLLMEQASSWLHLGNTELALGNLVNAEAAFRRALSLHGKLVTDQPNVPMYRRDLARSHNNLGFLLANQGKANEAEAAHRQALIIREKLVAEFPVVPEYRLDLAGNHINLGLIHQGRNQLSEAVASYGQAVATLDAILGREPNLLGAKLFLRNALGNRAEALTALKRYTDALTDWDRSLTFDDGSMRLIFRLHRAMTQVRAGDHAAAIRETQELTRDEKTPADALYDATCVCALAATAAKDNKELADNYAAQAMVLLARCRASGHFQNVAQLNNMKNDDDLTALRGRDDFQMMIKELDAKVSEKKPLDKK